MEGISHEAVLARRHARPRQAHRVLRRQRHLDRRRGQGLVHRRHAAALRGLRLERDPERRRPRRRRGRRGDQGGAGGWRDVGRPTLICCKTVIGKGAPTKAGTADAHGAALGEKEVAATREALGWTASAVRDPAGHLRGLGRARARRGAGAGMGGALRRAIAPRIPELAAEFTRRMARRAARRTGPRRCRGVRRRQAQRRDRRHAQGLAAGARGARARAAGTGRRLGRPHRLGVHQLVAAAWRSTRTAAGNYVNFGVREFAMSAIANGIALHGGFIPYVGTFLTFSDYARNALRMAALMKLRAIFVYTHDSIGLGEDGPTHQSVEHAASLRLIPHMDVWRPCDTVETAVGVGRGDRAPATVRRASCSRGRTCRSSSATRAQIADIRRGGYVLADFDGTPARAASCSSPPAPRSRSRWRRAPRSRPRASPCASCRCPAPACSTAGRGVSRGRAAARRAARRGRGRRHRRLAQVRRRADDPRGAVVGIDTLRRVGARGRAVQAFRLHRRGRRRRGAQRVAAAVSERGNRGGRCRHPRRDTRRCRGDRAGARRIVAHDLSRPDPGRAISPAMKVEDSAALWLRVLIGQRRTPPASSWPRTTARSSASPAASDARAAEIRHRRRALRHLSCPRSPARGHRHAASSPRSPARCSARTARRRLLTWVIAGNRTRAYIL